MAPAAWRAVDQVVEQVAALVVEPGVGLVEQPQLGPAGQQAGQRGPSPLTGRQAGHRQAGQAPAEPARVEGGVDVLRRGAPAARPQKRTLSAAVSSS